jgi:hypothetical protein
MGAYAQFADTLIGQGYAAVPIMAGSKRPGFYFNGQWIGLANWQRRFNNGPPPPAERKRWAAGDAGIGVVTGPPSHGLVGIDIDSEDPTIRYAILDVLPPTPVKKIGARGETLLYFAPDVAESRSWDIGGHRVLDLIGPGRQTVLPPTLHPDTGKPYVWSGTESLENLRPQDLPRLPADIADRITAVLIPLGYRPDEATELHERAGRAYHANDGDSPHRQLNDAALADLGAWVPALGLYRCRRARGGYEAVPTWRPSTTGRSPEKRHLNLKISPQGIKDFGADQGYTPLDLAMAACGCDLDTAFRFLSDCLHWGAAIDLSGLARQVGDAEHGDAGLVEPIEPVEESKPEALSSTTSNAVPVEQSALIEQPVPVDELERYTYVPGVVGEIIDWIVATSRRPNRVLALGGAITIVGTLIGRRVAGPTRSATHLYVVPIAPTGSGKQHLLDGTVRLLKSANAADHIGPSKFFSISAVLEMLKTKPLALCVQDEIGVFLAAVTHPRAGSNEKAVSQILRSLWGISFASMPTAQWASRKMKIICCPALSVLGVSTPDEFHAALQGESVDNGFLNRFLTLESKLRAVDRDPVSDPFTVPAILAKKLSGLYVWSGPESLLQIGNPGVEFQPDILRWADEPAQACYADFTRIVDDYMVEHSDSAAYLARCSETAIRLATIRAAGRLGRGASVDLGDMEWGAGIAWTAGQALKEAAQNFLPQTERGEWANKIASLLRRRGTMKPRDIQQHIRSRLRSFEIKDILGQLHEAGEVEWTPDGSYRWIENR